MRCKVLKSFEGYDKGEILVMSDKAARRYIKWKLVKKLNDNFENMEWT